MKKGICAKAPGWIQLELNGIWEFEEIEIAGWNGDTSIWSPTNGVNATILTSLDNKVYKKVGTLPSNFGASIQNVKLIKSKAKYVRFETELNIGIGYLNIKKLSSFK